MAQPARDQPVKGRKMRLALWLGLVLALAALMAPMFAAGDLRGFLARHRIEAGWQPEHGIIPRLQMAYSRKTPPSPSELDALEADLAAYKGTHPEFFWLALALLEARSGRLDQAKEALAKAKTLDPGIVNLTRGPEWDPWRKELGL